MSIVSTRSIDFAPFSIFFEPFPYAVSPRALNHQISFDVLEWLETSAPWKLVEADFYEQYEFSFDDTRTPSHLTFLRDEVFLDSLKSEVEKLLRVNLQSRVDATAHKLIPRQRIRIHNDFLPDGETHRLLIQLNRSWKDQDGGFLLFFNSPDPADVHRVFRPIHNSAVVFTISPESNHAVTTIHGNERFTLVYSFYAEK